MDLNSNALPLLLDHSIPIGEQLLLLSVGAHGRTDRCLQIASLDDNLILLPLARPVELLPQLVKCIDELPQLCGLCRRWRLLAFRHLAQRGHDEVDRACQAAARAQREEAADAG